MAALPSEQYAAGSYRVAEPEDELARRLYERHHRKIFAFCRHQLGSREEADDATQTTFLNAYRGL
jgi:DNA-directed RNA polymerase specialized sigma24 family protein